MTGVQRVPGRGSDARYTATSEVQLQKPEVWVTCTISLPVGKKYTLELCRVDREPVAVQTLPPRQMSTLYLGAILEL